MIKSSHIRSIYLLLTISLALMGCSSGNRNSTTGFSSSNGGVENVANVSLSVDKASYIDPAYLEKYWIDPSDFVDTAKYDPTLDLPKEGSPNAPSDLVIESSEKYIMKLSFTDNSKDESYFEITRATDPQFEKDVEFFKIEANDSEQVFFVDNIPSLKSEYFYQVRAINDFGPSNPVAKRASTTWLDIGHDNGGTISAFCRSVPVASFVTSNIGQNTVTISWAPSPGGFGGALTYEYTYRIHNSGPFGALASIPTNSITINSLQPGTTYDFMVRSHCSLSNSNFAPLTFTTLPSPCDTPVNLVASSVTDTTATLNWDAVAGAVSYNYQYRLAGGSWTSATIANNHQPITGLIDSSNYEFQVQAVCAVNSSAYSALANFTTLAPPCTDPINLTANPVTDTSATLNWDAVAGAVGYNYQYRLAGGSWTSATTANNNQPITGLVAASYYEFQVQAVCAVNSSAYSALANFTTLTSPCDQPTGLTATAISNNAATLNWNAAAGAISYNAQYRKAGGTWTSVPATTNSLVVTTLIPVSNYEFQVESVCATNSSGFTLSSNFVTGGVPQFDHIVLVIGENTSASAVFGSAYAPYINALAASGLKFTESYAITHPSQPNYLELYSGSNQGVTNDNAITNSPYTTANLGRELIDAGKTYTTFSEDLPSVGYNGGASGGSQGYVRRHNPAANWMGTGTNQIPTTTNQPFTAFPTNFNNLPSVSFVVPNICNDGHDDCISPPDPINNETKQYDDWVAAHLDAYKQWAINHNSLLIVTYDEDDFTAVNQISTVFYGAHMNVGTYNQPIDHHDVLRTIEDAMGVTTHAGAAATSSPVDFAWLP